MAMMEYAVASYIQRRRSPGLIKQIHRNQEEPMNQKKVRRQTLANIMVAVRPASVDVYSRILFPTAFLIFFTIYWIVLSFKLEKLPNDIIILDIPGQ